LNNTNADIQKNDSDRQNSVTSQLATLPKESNLMAQHQWNSSTAGALQPVYLETMGDLSQNAELEQYFMQTSEPPFDSIGAPFVTENLDSRQDIGGFISGSGGIPPQNKESLIRHNQQQFTPPWQPEPAQQSTHTPATVHPSRPQVQQLQSFPLGKDPSNSIERHRRLNSDQFSSNNSTKHTSHTLPTPSSSTDGSPSFPSLATADLASRFEHVICAIESAGFESIDDMSLQYYTASFREETVLYWAQSRSRARSLPHFLAAVHASSRNWSNREAQGYNQQITRAAESLYLDEFSCGRKDVLWDEERRCSSQDCSEKTAHSAPTTNASAAGIWHCIADIEASLDWKAKKAAVREKVC